MRVLQRRLADVGSMAWPDGVVLVEKWRVTARDMVAVCSQPSLSGVLDARMPGDEVRVASREGDWVRLHRDEGFGEQAAYMLVDGTSKGLGILMEFEDMVESKQAEDPKPDAVDGDEDAGRQVAVVVSHAEDNAELEVLVDRDATYRKVKKAIAKSLGREDILGEMQLVTLEHGAFVGHEDYDKLLDVRHLMALNIDFDVCGMEGRRMRARDAAGQFANLARLAPPSPLKGSSKGSPKGSTKGMSKGSSKGRGKPYSRRGAITKDEAMRLQRDLYDGFVQDSFQCELQGLAAVHKVDSPEYMSARQQLFLTVQAPILPKYGFEGGLAGVFKMMSAMRPFIDDADFVELASATNALMGIDLPPEGWSDFTFALGRRGL